jgi:hypothetical protein
VHKRSKDLSFPRSQKSYDKKGNWEFIWEVKKILFGDPEYRMTKRRCEEFFEEKGNFLNIGPVKEVIWERPLF